MNTSYSMVCVCAVILMVIGFLFARPLLSLFGASADAMVYAYPYMMIYLIGTLPSMVATGMNPFINAQGYSTVGMLSVTIGAVANLLLDPLFIFVFGFGVQGCDCNCDFPDTFRSVRSVFPDPEIGTESALCAER